MSNDYMCIHGYGAELDDIWPYIDTYKLHCFIRETYGFLADTELRKGESENELINRIDMSLVENTTAYSLSEVFDLLDTSRMTECVGNNRAEWFYYLPACMPWGYGTSMPDTPEEADALLLDVLRPLLRDEVSDDAIAIHFNDLKNIT